MKYLIALIAGILLACSPLLAFAQPSIERVVCAAPYPPPAASQPKAARLTLNGAPAGTCTIVQKASGAVPTCRVVVQMSAGPIAIGMAVQAQNDVWTTETIKGYAVELKSCSAPNAFTSVITCTAEFGPVPKEPMSPSPCGDPPPPIETWVAYGGTIFKQSNGKLLSSTGRTAAKGAPCRGTTVATAGTFVYQQLTGGADDEATRCVKP